jgi:aromatic ring-opening dioxygenase catalytic subunit (LigB family)
MAQITLGIGSSHSPMLSTPYDAFAGLGDLDRARLPEFAAKARGCAGWIDRELRPEVTRARHDATQAAIRHLGEVLAEEAPDAVVVIGDDQNEWFGPDHRPALCIYWGESVENLPPPRESVPPLRRLSYWGLYGDGANRAFPVDAALGRHLIETLTRDFDFDVAHLRAQPRHGPFGHAWSFVHQRLMGARVVPIVPVLLNTYYPPNQPTPRRCHQLGRAIRQVIEDWPARKRVAVLASGGLSHFFVDEELDRHVLDLLAKKDGDALSALPAARLESGNSEIRNWIATAGATEHLAMRLVDYVPSYRSEAGSGVGMAFAVWQ